MEFLTSQTSRKALEQILSFPLAPLPTVTCDVAGGLDRVSAEDVPSSEDLPPYPRSLVDGYAVRAQDTYGARETSPSLFTLLGEVQIGEPPAVMVKAGGVVAIATGAVVPEGADSVVMVEQTRATAGVVEVTRPVRAGENICFPGEDVAAGATILHAGKRLTPFDIGLLAALGVSRFRVYSRPRIAVISSGNEIVGIDEPKKDEQTRDINRYTVSGLLSRMGCDVDFIGVARDDLENVMEHLSRGRSYDLILISAGSSKGAGDLISAAIEGLGGHIIFHGINIKPGKPTIFAQLFERPLFGLPGHPVSCAMVLIRFVVPLVRRLAGEVPTLRSLPAGRLSTNVPSTYGIEEYVRVKLQQGAGFLSVTPLFAKSAVISSMSQAEGYIVIPEESEGLEGDEWVEVHPFG